MKPAPTSGIEAYLYLPAPGIPSLKSAGITGTAAAVGGYFSIQGFRIFCLEKILTDANIDVRPRQQFIKRTLPLCVELYVKSGLFKGLLPEFILKKFIPGIENSAHLPGAMNNLA